MTTMSDPVDGLIHKTLFDQYMRTLTVFTEQIVGPASSANDDLMLSVLADVLANISATTGRPLTQTFVTNLLDTQE